MNSFLFQFVWNILIDLKNIFIGLFLFFYDMLSQSKWVLEIIILGTITKFMECMGWIESLDNYDELHKKDVLFKRSVRKACNELELSNRTIKDLDKCVIAIKNAFSELQKN